MNKLLIAACLLALTACGTTDPNTSKAAADCRNMHYTPGTPEYQHCQIDMKNAEDLNTQNQQMMK
jgi:hypothetical protein